LKNFIEYKESWIATTYTQMILEVSYTAAKMVGGTSFRGSICVPWNPAAAAFKPNLLIF